LLRQLFPGPHFLLEVGTQCRQVLLQGVGSLLPGQRLAFKCLKAARRVFQAGLELLKALGERRAQGLDLVQAVVCLLPLLREVGSELVAEPVELLAVLTLNELTHLSELADEGLTQYGSLLFSLCLSLQEGFVELAVLFRQIGQATLGHVHSFKKQGIPFGLKEHATVPFIDTSTPGRGTARMRVKIAQSELSCEIDG
jgi:hypothetical protein